jgi:8-oxo-dGTP pyrophosphatase MutT (NUDIX family)
LHDSNSSIVHRGVVAVIVRDERFLVIRRSQTVIAPGAFCFPGGGIEAAESEHDALVREIQEELGVAVRPIEKIWRSVTSWRVELAWWTAELPADAQLVPNLAEVESVHWHTAEELGRLEPLLESNRRFLEGIAGGAISLVARVSPRP